MADSICMKVGDRRPVLRVQLGFKDEPAPVNNPLSGAVAVRLRMIDRESGTHTIDDALGLIESVDTRIVSYSWAAGDTDQAGDFEAFFVVDYGGGVFQTFPSCTGLRVCIE